jgi:alkylation response protein AidB-like acyl-CoA dehydrogenase
MDLDLSDEQLDLRTNIRNVLESVCPPEFVRSFYEGTPPEDALWRRTLELGWTALAVPEAIDGLGLGFVEIGLLAEELGRATAPATLLAATTQVLPLLIELGANDLVKKVAAGEGVAALAFAERGSWSLANVQTRARHGSDGWTLTGDKHAVLAGASAGSFAVIAKETKSNLPGVFWVDRSNAKVEVRPSIDPALLLADVTLEDARATPISEPSAQSAAAIERAAEQAVVGVALHTVGACRRILEVSLEYAKVRKQFGRAIGSFQALKHRFADMLISVERASALCYFAACSIAEDAPSRREAVHMAKAVAGSCQCLLAQDGLQLHGGIGFTWEHDLHFLLKRAKAGELLCGTSAFHRAQLASMLSLIRDATRETK